MNLMRSKAVNLSDAKSYIGKRCEVTWNDRFGKLNVSSSVIYDVTFVPLYGGYVVTDEEDIRLDRVSNICLMEEITTIQFQKSEQLPLAA